MITQELVGGHDTGFDPLQKLEQLRQTASGDRNEVDELILIQISIAREIETEAGQLELQFLREHCATVCIHGKHVSTEQRIKELWGHALWNRRATQELRNLLENREDTTPPQLIQLIWQQIVCFQEELTVRSVLSDELEQSLLLYVEPPTERRRLRETELRSLISAYVARLSKFPIPEAGDGLCNTRNCVTSSSQRWHCIHCGGRYCTKCLSPGGSSRASSLVTLGKALCQDCLTNFPEVKLHWEEEHLDLLWDIAEDQSNTARSW